MLLSGSGCFYLIPIVIAVWGIIYDGQPWHPWRIICCVLFGVMELVCGPLFVLLTIGIIAYAYMKSKKSLQPVPLGAPRFGTDSSSTGSNGASSSATRSTVPTVPVAINPKTYAFPYAASEGWLAERGSASGLSPKTMLYMSAKIAELGTVVVGPSGSGKTSAVLQPFIYNWLLAPTYGMFAYGIKPNWSSKMRNLAFEAGRLPETVHIVGPRGESWPLMRGLSPDAIGSFFAESSKNPGGGDGDYFVRSASGLAQNIATVLLISTQYTGSYVWGGTSFDYDLRSLSRIASMNVATFKKFVDAMRDHAILLDETHGQSAASHRLLDSLERVSAVLADMSDRQRDGVTGTLKSVLDPFFTDADFERAFSGTDSSGNSFELGQSLDAGHVVILDVDMSRYPAAARFAYLLAFEQLQGYMQVRLTRPESTRNPILFCSDEYAEIASDRHSSMWRTSREAGICALIAYQIHSDLCGRLGKDKADGMMRNMGTTILFATSDPASIDLVRAGQTEQIFETTSSSQGSSSSSGATWESMLQSGNNTGVSKSYAHQQRQVLDEQLIEFMENHLDGADASQGLYAHAVIRTKVGARRAMDVCRVWRHDAPEYIDRPGVGWERVSA